MDSQPQTNAIRPSETKSKHEKCLYMLCRICAAVLSDYTYLVARFCEDLQRTFKVDFHKDIEGVHPTGFCQKCYATVNHNIDRGSIPTFKPVQWKPHIRSLFCETCALREQKSKGGRPKKKT
jgi:hypothetical protein